MTLVFDYRPFNNVRIPPGLSAPNQSPVRHRPLVPIRVFGPVPPGLDIYLGGAFADTGTDYTVVRNDVASILGVSFAKAVHSINQRWRGIDYAVRFFPVRLELHDGMTTATWPSIVGFTDAPLPYDALLGQTGFFEFFQASFDGERLQLQLTPNGIFRSVGGILAP